MFLSFLPKLNCTLLLLSRVRFNNVGVLDRGVLRASLFPLSFPTGLFLFGILLRSLYLFWLFFQGCLWIVHLQMLRDSLVEERRAMVVLESRIILVFTAELPN